jgi:hypothetical protein
VLGVLLRALRGHNAWQGSHMKADVVWIACSLFSSSVHGLMLSPAITVLQMALSRRTSSELSVEIFEEPLTGPEGRYQPYCRQVRARWHITPGPDNKRRPSQTLLRLPLHLAHRSCSIPSANQHCPSPLQFITDRLNDIARRVLRCMQQRQAAEAGGRLYCSLKEVRPAKAYQMATRVCVHLPLLPPTGMSPAWVSMDSLCQAAELC